MNRKRGKPRQGRDRKMTTGCRMETRIKKSLIKDHGSFQAFIEWAVHKWFSEKAKLHAFDDEPKI